ncbi:MAG: YcgN family cysteine cluster protein [Rhodospirillaceae bacterium]
MNKPSQPSAKLEREYWRKKKLTDMSHEEWEALCDGCGKCCLHKIRGPGNSLQSTNVGCRLLDVNSCRCKNYPKRKKLVPDCVVLSPESLEVIDWLPRTCAYRLVKNGQDLPHWHPLVSGDPESVHRAGVSVRGRSISEQDAGPLHTHVVPWHF